MIKQLDLFFSNQVEQLYSKLKKNLFCPLTTHPFTKRTIIVPSPAMKIWLSLRFADDPEIGVATGFKISYLDNAIYDLTKQFCLDPEVNIEKSSHLDTALLIESVIRRVLCDEEKGVLWKPLFDYLQVPDFRNNNSATLTKKTQKRIVALSNKLATLFQQYEKYGSTMLLEWESSCNIGWQQEIWRRVNGKAPRIPKHWKYSDAHIYLFALSFLSQWQHDFFLSLSQIFPVKYYLLSPCQAFWTDILSDRESLKLQKFWQAKGLSLCQQQELEHYLYDRNPLLANFGRLGRETVYKLEKSDVTPREEYVLPINIAQHSDYIEKIQPELFLSQSKQPLSLVEAIQADLLLLRSPSENSKIAIPQNDRSLQIHIATSMMREVQILYNTLLSIIDKHSELEPICPSDIIVMAPDIMAYEPYIRAVFEAEESQLTCQIMDLHLLAKSPLVQGFLHLLSLSEGRWDAVSVLRLLDFPSFQRKQKFREEDVKRIRTWIKDADVRWGENPSHRNEVLKNESCSQSMLDEDPSGTWQFAIDRLLMGLTFILPEEIDDQEVGMVLPVETIDSSQAELLGKWILLLRSLREDLMPFSDGSQYSLKDWSVYLQNLLQKYFQLDVNHETEGEDYTNLFNILRKLWVERCPAEALFPFSSIHYHLKTHIEKERICYRENDLQAVRFCSMLPMRAVPAKVISVLGMDEDAYPRHEVSFSLNLMKGHSNADYCPSQAEFDRYLFLEMLLSCRKVFIMSYVDNSPDVKERAPSLLITELLNYIDKSYTINNVRPSLHCVWKHPFQAFDKSYFQKKSALKNFSKKNYEFAKVYYQHLKRDTHAFVPQFQIMKNEDPSLKGRDCLNQNLEGVSNPLQNTELKDPGLKAGVSPNLMKQSRPFPIEIDLKRLISLARNPIESYFNHTLGIYLEKEDAHRFKADEEFFISALDAAILKKGTLRKPMDSLLRIAEKRGKLPLGPFKNIVYEKLNAESAEIAMNLEKLNVKSSLLFDIEFSDQYRRPEKSASGKWLLPPLELKFKNEISIKIMGNLKEVAPEGLVAFIDDNKTDVLKYWPQFLVCQCLSKDFEIPVKPQLLFVKSGKARQSFFDDPYVQLEKYLDYYFLASENISPLIPEWVPDLLSGKFSSSKIEDLLTGKYHFYNSYLKWMIQNGGKFKAEEIIREWKQYADSLFGELYAQWY